MGQLKEAKEAMGATPTTKILQVMEKDLVEREEERETACHLKKKACRWRWLLRLPGMRS